jgi:hypothetical protein
MKITDRLLEDRKRFRVMLAELDQMAMQGPPGNDMRRLLRLVEEFRDQKLIHAWYEDRFFYRVVRQALPTAKTALSAAYMDQLERDHDLVDLSFARLEADMRAQPPRGTWPQTYTLFSKALTAHMEKE